jgi:hypothetical protein
VVDATARGKISMKIPGNDPDGACGRLADYLQAHKESIMKAWLAQARADTAVLSDALTQLELVDHVPRIFDAMVQALRNQCSRTKDDVQEVTARHTVIRWVQHYDLRAVLREVSLLRAEFIRHLLAFAEQDAGLTGQARLSNATTIHRILDDIVMDATDTFLKLKSRADEDGGNTA